MYKKMKKIIAIMLIFILTITHINIMGLVFATEISSEEIEYIENDNYLLIQLPTTFRYADIIIHNNYNKMESFRLYGGEAKYIPIESLLEQCIEVLKNEEKINLNDLEESMEFYITKLGVDTNGNNKGEKENFNLLNFQGFLSESFNNSKNNIFMEVSKYIPYNINGTKGVVLETVVQSYLESNVLPIKDTKIEEYGTNNAPFYNSLRIVADAIVHTGGNDGDRSGHFYICFILNDVVISPDGKISWKNSKNFEINYAAKANDNTVAAENVFSKSVYYNIQELEKTDWIVLNYTK